MPGLSPDYPTLGRRLPQTVGLSLLLSLFVGSAEAHPHVWVDYELTAVFEHGQITALRQDWTFDEDFSESVVHDVTRRHGTGNFNEGETAKLKQKAFSNLKNYDYFTHTWAGREAVPIDREVSEFSARLADSKLSYSFTVLLSKPLDPRAAPVRVGIWDDTYYVDVGPAKGAQPKLEGQGAEGCKATIVEDHDHPIYFGAIFPRVIQISC